MITDLFRDTSPHISLEELYKQIPPVIGCNNCGRCCTTHVRISIAEIENIPLEAWKRFPNRADACRFLRRDGKCGIYEYRPFTCRMWGIGHGSGEACVHADPPMSYQEMGRLSDLYEEFYTPIDLRIMT